MMKNKPVETLFFFWSNFIKLADQIIIGKWIKMKDDPGKGKNIEYFTRVFLGFFTLLMMIAIILILVKSIFFPDRSDLIEERIKPGPGTKW